MPEPALILTVLATAALTAFASTLLFGWPWRASSGTRASIGMILGLCASLYLGCRQLGLLPHWPPRDDQDRFLLVVMPSLFLVEILATVIGRRNKASGLVRLAFAAATAPALLYHSVYFANPDDLHDLNWSPRRLYLILAGLALVLLLLWSSLLELADRAAPFMTIPILSITLGCAGLAIMMSGSATCGLLALPFVGGLAGAAIASRILKPAPPPSPLVGVGVVALFSLLVMGRFFSDLALTTAGLVLLAPLMGWLPALIRSDRLGGWRRHVLRLVAVGVPLALALTLAYQQFSAASKSDGGPGDGSGPSLKDYMNFGK